MAFSNTVKPTIHCPQCDKHPPAPLTRLAQTYVCPICSAVLDVRQEEPTYTGETSPKAMSNIPLPIGAKGTLNGETYRVLGWIRYRGSDGTEGWSWEEWRLRSIDGNERWLSYSAEEGFLLLQQAEVQELTNGLHAGDSIHTTDGEIPITERTTGIITEMAGTFCEDIRLRDSSLYLTGRKGRLTYSFEQSDQTLEVFKGQPASKGEIGRAFDVRGLNLKMLWNGFSSPNIPLVIANYGGLSLSDPLEADGGLSIAETQKEGQLSTLD
jgi:hypothetical protein